jgi:hypothetical protein
MAATASPPLLDASYPLTDAHKARFREDGFIKLPGVLDGPTLAEFDRALVEAGGWLDYADARY